MKWSPAPAIDKCPWCGAPSEAIPVPSGRDGFAAPVITAVGDSMPRQRLTGWSLYLTLAIAAAAIVWVLTHGGLARGQFVRGDEEAFLRGKIPLAEFRNDPAVRIYTRRSMPRVYQHDGCAHSPLYNISGEEPETFLPNGRGGNWAINFPYSTPAGVRRAPTQGVGTVTHFAFLRLPPGRPVVYYFEGGRWCWLFPLGAVLGEVLCLRSPAGVDLAFELRIKTRELHAWVSAVHRPFPTAEHLVDAIKAIRPQWPGDPELVALVAELERPRAMQVLKLVDTHHVYPAIRATSAIDVLPAMRADLVTDLLTRFEFDDATGTRWRGDCFAPTSRHAFSIYPANYDGAFMGSDDRSCRECHRTAGLDGDLVDPRRPKQKYGNIPGGDEIFSYHPFAPRCISYNGANLPPAFRNEADALEPFHPARHSRDHYRRLKP